MMEKLHGKCGINTRYWQMKVLILIAFVALFVASFAVYKHHNKVQLILSRGNEQPSQYSLPSLGGPPSHHAPSTGYIMSLSYSGQMGSNVRALLSMQCWAASYNLPVLIVEPLVDGTELSLSTHAIRSVNATGSMRFRDFFDINHLNQISIGPPLVPWEDFIQNAPRNVIHVMAKKYTKYSCNPKQKTVEVISDPYTTQRNHCSLTEKYLDNSHLQDAGFCVVRVVNLLMNCLFTPQGVKQMYKHIYQGWNPVNVTVIFNFWAANWDGLYNQDRTNNLTCKDPDGRKIKYTLRPSPRLLGDAQQYVNTFLSVRNKVAVMIRSEQALIGFKRLKSQDSVQNLGMCLKKTVKLAKNLSYPHQTRGAVFLTLDIGKYGSESLQRMLHFHAEDYTGYARIVKNTAPVLYDGKWTFEEWESSFDRILNGVENPGYVASLQRAIASQADCLILMGGGDYQRLAFTAYQENHPNVSRQCVHFLCIRDKLRHQFTRLHDFQ